MGPITRICRVLAFAALASAGVPALAGRSEPSVLTVYARARIAENHRETEAALANYRAALGDSPGEIVIALRAYRAAMDGGDYSLAVQAARALDGTDVLPPDARLLLFVAAVRRRDWAEARMRLGTIRADTSFAFAAPLLAKWLDPQTAPDPVETSYAAETSALTQLSGTGFADGVTRIRSLWTTDPYRATSLRIVAGATLAERGHRGEALSLLLANDRATLAARKQIERKRALPVAVGDAARGAAFLFARMAGDLVVEDAARSGIALARLSMFADPENPRNALIAAGALAVAKRPRAALALIDAIIGDPVYGDDATSLRIDLLEATGRSAEALAAARERAGLSANDRARAGDIEARMGNHAAAAANYDAVIADAGNAQNATLLLAAGNAHEQNGDWAAARPLFERALVLTPDDPRLLNQLGFGLIEHGEDVPRALAMIERADRLQPDNAAIVDSLGWAQFRQKNYASAATHLERARALAPTEPEIGEHLGDAYWASGRRIEARYAWQAAREVAEGDRAIRLASKIERGPQ